MSVFAIDSCYNTCYTTSGGGGSGSVPRTFGIEIEMVGRSRPTVAQAVQSVTGGIVESVPDMEDESLVTEIVTVSAESRWLVEDDDSLGVASHARAEVVSPVLNRTDVFLVKDVVRALAECGAKTNDRCGIHVHIGATESSHHDLNRLIELMIIEEPKLIERFKCSENRLKRFAKPMSAGFIKRFGRNRPESLFELEKLWYGRDVDSTALRDRYDSSRYRGLNLHSCFYRGTVEFRYFDGSLDPERVGEYIETCIDLADRAGLH